MGLDYGYTCSEIDGHISDFKDTLSTCLDTFIDEVCPLLEGNQRLNLIKGYVNSIYEDSDAIFEGVRKCNEDMRQEADRQYDELETKVEEWQQELRESEDKCFELEEENLKLQEQ